MAAVLHGSVSPLGELVAEELAVKLDTPGLNLSFERLYASEIALKMSSSENSTSGLCVHRPR